MFRSSVSTIHLSHCQIFISSRVETIVRNGSNNNDYFTYERNNDNPLLYIIYLSHVYRLTSWNHLTNNFTPYSSQPPLTWCNSWLMYAKGYPHRTLSSYNILAPRSIPCTTSSRQSLANFIFKNVVITVLMIPSYISRVLYALGRCNCYSSTNIYNPLYPSTYLPLKI